MFKRLRQNKRAQQTAEYAILIALVVGAVIAMQTYAQRTIQARIRGASQYLAARGAGEGNALGTDLQYEPYYLDSQYDVTREEETTETLDNSVFGKDMQSNRTRALGGYQKTTFDNADQTRW